MKFAHLADLHLGMVVNHVSMAEEQKHILKEIVKILEEEKPDALLIAGDVYDKAVPSVEAVNLLDDFLTDLVKYHIRTYLIAGNHDQGDRLAYAGHLLASQGIHICGNFDGKMDHDVLADAFGKVHVWLLPYIRPSYVNRYLDEDERVGSYQEAVAKAIAMSDVDFSKRNVIVSHQFVTGAQVDPLGSEQLIVGGLDEISSSVYDGFDYAALGHIHRRQKINDHVIYAGTPLAYSFAEEKQEKSISFIQMEKKGTVHVYTRTLTPLHHLRTIEGYYKEILSAADEDENKEDYVRFVLHDNQEQPDAIRYLRQLYPNAMRLEYDNERTRAEMIQPVNQMQTMSPSDLFARFYKERNGVEMSTEQISWLKDLIDEIWNGGEQV
ncbi:MAG: exonuclease SbcCD subunit D [Lactimicrobium sp.]|jgi:exonuclease SbcD|uniref:exonuclease SbcCD subunit D n=1 Tax=Lactimicrobium sp. TaxID=2563780 RepID=UPI002F3528D7